MKTDPSYSEAYGIALDILGLYDTSAATVKINRAAQLIKQFQDKAVAQQKEASLKLLNSLREPLVAYVHGDIEIPPGVISGMLDEVDEALTSEEKRS